MFILCKKTYIIKWYFSVKKVDKGKKRKGKSKVRKNVIIGILSMVMVCSLSACGVGKTDTDLKSEKIDEGETSANEESVSKTKNIIENAIKLNNFDEMKNYVEKFSNENIQTIHLDDVVLTADEFALTDKDDYSDVLKKVSEGRTVEKNIAGDVTISFSDFELEYSRIYENGLLVGVTVNVKPKDDKCDGFYIECADSDWYITDDFLICSEYPDYSDILDEVYSLIDIEEEKLDGDGIVGIWYSIRTSDQSEMNCIYVFYNDNTGILIVNHVVNCNFTYEIQDDENMLIDYSPEKGNGARQEKYTLDNDTWIENIYDDRWVTYARIK